MIKQMVGSGSLIFCKEAAAAPFLSWKMALICLNFLRSNA